MRITSTKQFMLLVAVHIGWMLVAVETQRYNPIPFPIAYNQHQRQRPIDVNDLSAEYVQRAMNDVSTTIEQVQRMLAKDPTLPRLTRGEVEELFENVTKDEYEKSLHRGDRHRAKHMRALMLVLPYNTNNVSSSDSLEELYRKPPVTRLVDTGVKPKPQPIQFDPPSGATKIVSAPKETTTTYRPAIVKKIVTSKPTKDPNRNQMTITTFNPNSSKHKYSSHYSLNAAPFVAKNTFLNQPQRPTQAQFVQKKPVTDHSGAPMRNNVKGMLASIGLFPEKDDDKKTEQIVDLPIFKKLPQKETPPPFIELSTKPPQSSTLKPPPEITPELQELLKSFGLLKEEPGTVSKFGFEQNKFEGLDDIPTVSLHSPFINTEFHHEFRPLPEPVANIGPIPNVETSHFYRMTPEIRPNDFTSFKPIQVDNQQTSEEYDTELENLLKSFGLINNKRNKKSLPPAETTDANSTATTTIEPPTTTTTPPAILEEMAPVYVDMLPNSMASVLENLGVSTIKSSNHNHDEKKPRRVGSPNAQSFRPAAYSKSDDEDFAKLHQLLDTIKQLDNLNANLTDEEISKLNLQHFNLSESLLAKGPDPVVNAELIQLKNEVKRQEPVRISLITAGVDEKNAGAVTTTEKTESIVESSDKIDSDDDDLKTTSTTTTTTTSTTTESSIKKADLEDSFGGGADPVTEEPLPPPRRNGFYFLQDFNTFLEVGEDPDKVEVRYERKFGDPSRFIPVTVP